MSTKATKQVLIRLELATWKQLKHIAADNESNLNRLINELIKECLAKR